MLFVADGLRPSSVNATDTPALAAVRDTGVYFANSHSVFPTVTMVNAASIATGHLPGDTGIYGNNPWIRYRSFDTGNFSRPPGSPMPFLENDQVLADVVDHYSGNLLGERTLLSVAREAGFGTATIGKLGPVALQDVTQLQPLGGRFPVPKTVFIDDVTGLDGIPLTEETSAALRKAHLPSAALVRLQPSGDRNNPGTRNANWGQQVYFVDTAVDAVLPQLKLTGQPFLLVYWSRDPDGSQHNQGDSLQSLWPGINGETSALAVRNADHNLKLLMEAIHADPDLSADTDIIVTSDHGFATVGKKIPDSWGKNSIARPTYSDVAPGHLPPGFLAIDLAVLLKKPLFDPDVQTRNERGETVYQQLNPASQHPVLGNGILGGGGLTNSDHDAEVLISANGGSDAIYLPEDNLDLVRTIISHLVKQNYVGGLFVNDRYGSIPGTLPMSAINLSGTGKLPAPAIIVAFRTYELSMADADGTLDPLRRVVQIADTTLQQGQGTHGGFGRESTFNFMAAMGPDFRTGVVDTLPASNADIAPTLSLLLNLPLRPTGTLTGRALTEALRTSADGVSSQPRKCVAASSSADGRQTVLHYQEYAGNRYLDFAEFSSSEQRDPQGCGGPLTKAPEKLSSQ